MRHCERDLLQELDIPIGICYGCQLAGYKSSTIVVTVVDYRWVFQFVVLSDCHVFVERLVWLSHILWV